MWPDDEEDDWRYQNHDPADESEGERQARRHYERMPNIDGIFGKMGAGYRGGGGKSVASVHLMAQELARQRAQGKNTSVGIAYGGSVYATEGSKQTDCTVVKLHQETHKAYCVDLMFMPQEDTVAELKHVWVPKTECMVTGNMMRLSTWILIARERDLKIGSAIADNLLKNMQPKR